jgi:translation initiation factor 4A
MNLKTPPTIIHTMTSIASEEKTTPKSYSINEWDDSDLIRSNILRGVYAYGFEKPSPIQKNGIVPMLTVHDDGKRRDIIAQAQSGTGKTGCFSVGVLNIVDPSVKETQALILAPTHELASQIKNVVSDIGRFDKIVVQLLVGGTSVDGDREKLDNDTPHSVVVLDEADEMLSQGFKEQIYKIFQYMPNEIQIGLFSATMPQECEELSDKFMTKPIKILVKAEQLTLQGIAQYYIRVNDDEQKYLVLKDIFTGMSISQAIIYCNSTRRVDDLHEAMVADEYPVSKIHGKLDEAERKETNKAFRSGASRVLITSDLYARGIDVQQVSIVINFDVPKSEHTYLHRIGRSGRWGRKGIAVNFITKHDGGRLRQFEQYYNTQIEEMPADWTGHLKSI